MHPKMCYTGYFRDTKLSDMMEKGNVSISEKEPRSENGWVAGYKWKLFWDNYERGISELTNLCL